MSGPRRSRELIAGVTIPGMGQARLGPLRRGARVCRASAWPRRDESRGCSPPADYANNIGQSGSHPSLRCAGATNLGEALRHPGSPRAGHDPLQGVRAGTGGRIQNATTHHAHRIGGAIRKSPTLSEDECSSRPTGELRAPYGDLVVEVGAGAPGKVPVTCSPPGGGHAAGRAMIDATSGPEGCSSGRGHLKSVPGPGAAAATLFKATTFIRRPGHGWPQGCRAGGRGNGGHQRGGHRASPHPARRKRAG